MNDLDTETETTAWSRWLIKTDKYNKRNICFLERDWRWEYSSQRSQNPNPAQSLYRQQLPVYTALVPAQYKNIQTQPKVKVS